jgi:uncharacterized protein HemX
MSEKTETIEKKPAAKPKPKKERDGSSGAFLAMLIALGAAGGSYYIWQQHLIAEQDRMVLEESIEELLTVVEQKDQAQQIRIEQLKSHQHNDVEQRVATLEQSLPELNQRLSVQQQEWGLAEVDYLLRTAEHRLQLNRDIPTAIIALEQAREQLTNHTNGEFVDVIGAIDQYIAEISQQKGNGLEPISALIASSASLPVALAAPGEVVTNSAPQPLDEGAELMDKMKYWGKVVLHDIKSLVTIRKSDDRQQPIIGEQQAELLRGQLAIKLESARLAALQHNQALYSTTLAEAKGLLESRFDGTDTAVQGAIATLDVLGAIHVDTPLPSLNGLRQQLHAAQAAMREEPATAEEPGEMQP